MGPLDLEAIAQTLAGAAAGATVRATKEALLELGELRDLSSEIEPEQRLGAGGMGEVFLGRQRSLRRLIALKRSKDESTAALVAEARLIGALEHPHIVPVHALGLGSDGRPMLVMKRIEGVTLQKLIDEPAHAAWQGLIDRAGDRLGALVEIIARVADALEFAHERGVIHRDLKPENVMVGAHGEVYLLDWGIALDDLGRQGLPALVGTPAFMAPEMLSGDPAAIDRRTDVFLLGATLHAALTGQPRHQGTTLFEVVSAAAKCAPFPYGREVPEELAALANRATSVDPSRRPESAAKFRDELAVAMRQRGSIALARELEARIAALGPEPSGEALTTPKISELLLESRLSLRRALQEFPHNAVAATTLQRVLELTVIAHLHHDDLVSAEETAAQLSPRSARIADRLENARRRVSEARQFEQLGRAEAKEQDLQGGRLALVVLLAVLALSGAVLYATLGVDDHDSMLRFLGLDAGILVLLASVAVAFRQRIASSRKARALTATLFLTLISTFSAHLFGFVQGLRPPQIAPYSLLCLALGTSLAGVSSGRWFFFGGAVMWSGAVLALLLPGQVDVVVPVAVVLANVLSGREILRQAKETAKEPAHPR